MAHYEHRTRNTYRLVVDTGLDSTGKRVRKRKTIKIDDSLTPAQREKELNRQLILFEQEVIGGNYLDGEKLTFAQFCERWLKDYAEINLSPATIVSYKKKLEQRILPALGHIIIGKMQPVHLLSFYKNLNEDNIRFDGKYTPTQKLCEFLNLYTPTQIEKATGISFKTSKRLKAGMNIDYTIAQKLCNAYDLNLKKMFYYETGKKLSAKTIHLYMGVISIILSTAVKWNVIKDNPSNRIDIKRGQKAKARYYDEEQIAEMLSALSKEPILYVVMVYLAIDTGMRKGELTGLTWEDVDFNKSTISINKQRHYVMGYGVLEDKPKTDAGIRIVTVSKTVMNLLKQYHKQQLKNKLKFGTAYKNEPYVFLHDDGTAIAPHRPYVWFTNFLQRYNLPKITFHQLRHTNASLLISSGEDIVTVSGRLGHSDKNITLNTYSHIIKSKEAQVANKMDKFYERVKVSNRA